MGKLSKGLLGLGLMALIALSAASFWAARYYDVSLRFLVGRALERAGIDDHRLNFLLQPPQRYVNQSLDGMVRQTHPRILLPELTGWNGEGVAPSMAERLARHASAGSRVDNYPACGRKHAMSHVVCWLTTGESSEARQAVNTLLAGQLAPLAPGDSGGNSWQWALAFDLLSSYSGMTPHEREIITAKLRDNLEGHLQLLDDDSPSLWHGRSSLAAEAWLLAVVLYGEPGIDISLTRRAQGHFQETIRALSFTEAWPEGYNYWINSRALVIALAGSAWVNGLEQSHFAPTVLQALRRVGLWTVYATRPDHRIEALGDEGPRVDLKDETRRVIDVIAQLTGDSVFASYSSYLEKLHRAESYYRGYRWSFMLFNDPSIPRLPGIAPGELTGLQRYLPLSELFGAGAMNLLIVRTGWGPDDTFVSMHAGHTFTHHGHYGAGHFTVFKGAPLAIDSSKYNGFFSPHRIYYGIRTVAKNSLLVVRPGDMIRPHRLIEKTVNDGGQRLVMPTGSRVRNIDHWSSHLGAGGHYEGGELQDYHLQVGRFAYIKADLTGAYDSTRYDTQGSDGKVSSVERELLYLFGEDRLLVRDEVIATDASYVKKWLLHAVNKPLVEDVKIVLGDNGAGILESDADTIRVENGRGRLDVKRILPEAAILRLVGGDGYKYHVEIDAEDPRASGRLAGDNFSEGAADKPWFDNGAWRVEIQPRIQQEVDEFLVALSPSLGLDRSREVEALSLLSGDASTIATPHQVVVFTGGDRLGELSFILPDNQRILLIVGVVVGDSYQLVLDGESVHYEARRSGVLEVTLPPGAQQGGSLTLRQN